MFYGPKNYLAEENILTGISNTCIFSIYTYRYISSLRVLSSILYKLFANDSLLI